MTLVKNQDSTQDSVSRIGKHKAVSTRKADKPEGQAFDIIPRSQVRPDATSRPVITANHLEVADNTITSPSTAPQLQLKHRSIAVSPSDEIQDDDNPPTIKESGVSVSELIAKSNTKVDTDEVEDDYFLSASEPPVKDALITDTDEEPESTGMTAPALSSPPAEEVDVTADGTTPPEAEHSAEPIATVPPERRSMEDVKPPAANLESLPTEGSLEQALQDDADEPPQEHSQALKDAIKDMDGKTVSDDTSGHHGLYGGKPVIVVHKGRGSRSGLSWLLWLLLCLLLALLAVNLLLDADVISTGYNIPHTDIL